VSSWSCSTPLLPSWRAGGRRRFRRGWNGSVPSFDPERQCRSWRASSSIPIGKPVILDRILEHKKQEIKDKKKATYWADLKARIREAPAPMGFYATLAGLPTPPPV